MSRRLAISALLNSDDLSPGLSMVDVRDKIDTLVASAGPSGPVHVPQDIAEMLSRVVAHLTLNKRVPDAITVRHSPAPIFSISGFPSYPTPSIQHNVVMNKKTVITTLFTYEDVHAYVEYPESGPERLRPVGYLFRRDPENWQSPLHNFAYSLGGPSGGTKKGLDVRCKLLVDSMSHEVPCIEKHYNCMLPTNKISCIYLIRCCLRPWIKSLSNYGRRSVEGATCISKS